MIHRQDLLDEASCKGLEVFQLTADSMLPSSHIYTGQQKIDFASFC